jgi:hypothetical protein
VLKGQCATVTKQRHCRASGLVLLPFAYKCAWCSICNYQPLVSNDTNGPNRTLVKRNLAATQHHHYGHSPTKYCPNPKRALRTKSPSCTVAGHARRIAVNCVIHRRIAECSNCPEFSPLLLFTESKSCFNAKLFSY